MDWIKKHPHLLTLILVALGVLASAGLLVMNSGAFDSTFDSVRQTMPKGTKVYQQAQEAIVAAKEEFKSPALWSAPKSHYSLFVSELYKLDDSKTKLVQPNEESHPHTMTGDPIPYKWFQDHNLNFYAPNILRQDADGDGFWNEDEWLYKTDPNNKDSHPPYYTRLFLVRHIRQPFLIKFQAINGDPEKDKPEDLEFQINLLSTRQRTQFLKVGADVPNTKFKIQKFERKPPVVDANGVEKEAHELTLVNTETGDEIKVVINQTTDSPDSFALFTYLHPEFAKPEYAKYKQMMQVRKLQQFALVPEKDQLYKLLDISDEKAVIQSPSGEKIEIPKLPAGYP